MFCTKCGTKNEAGKEVCQNCGEKLFNVSGGSSTTVKIPEKITIDTSFVNKLTKWQQMYVGGGILVLISSFLPLINFKSPDLGAGMGSLAMGGASAALKSNSINIWTLGVFNLATILYLLPLVVLGYLAYQELVVKKSMPTYIKSLTLALTCLLTFSANLYVVIAIGQMQSFLGTMAKFSGAEAMMGDLLSLGIGAIGGVAGCLLVSLGLLGEIKETAK